MRRPSLLPLHDACPPALLDPSFRMVPFADMDSLRDGMRLMPGRTDVNRKPKRRAGSPGEMSMSRKRKVSVSRRAPRVDSTPADQAKRRQQLEQRRKENARFNNLTAPAAFASPAPVPPPRPSPRATTSGSGSAQSPRHPGAGLASPRSGRTSRHGSPAGSSHGSRGSPSGSGGAGSGVKIKLKLGGSPKPS